MDNKKLSPVQNNSHHNETVKVSISTYAEGLFYLFIFLCRIVMKQRICLLRFNAERVFNKGIHIQSIEMYSLMG